MGSTIPSRSLPTTRPGTYRCYRHYKTFRWDWFDRPLLPFANSPSQILLGQLTMGSPISWAPWHWVSLVCVHTVGRGPNRSVNYYSPCCWAVLTPSDVISEMSRGVKDGPIPTGHHSAAHVMVTGLGNHWSRGGCIPRVLGGRRSPALAAVPAAWKKTLPKKALSGAGSASPHARGALVC